MGKCLVHTDCKWPKEGVNYSCEYHTKTTFINLNKLFDRMSQIVFPRKIGRKEYLEQELTEAAKKTGFNQPVIADLWGEDQVYFFELAKADHWEIDEDGNHVQLWEQVLTWGGKELEPRDRVEYELELREEYERKRDEERKQFNRGWPEDKRKKKPS